MDWHDVIQFWFEELSEKDWWGDSTRLDGPIAERFGALHAAVSAAEMWSWRKEPEGRLAEILVLDQFSRHIHRDTPSAFAQDAMALALAQEAVDRGVDQKLAKERRHFLYMPFMHSESLKVHDRAMELFKALGIAVDFEIRHRDIIIRFGRYPHRNESLGRTSTPEELEFLKQPGSSF
jgi:uncharacterized protein (DUF924 family)